MSQNPDILNRYSEVIGLSVGEKHMDIVRKATQSVIYGKYVERYLQKAIDTIEQSASAIDQVDLEDIPEAIAMFAQATLMHETNYIHNHPGILESEAFIAAIKELHTNVSNGIINLLPPEFWMTPDEGQTQVEFADDYFSNVRKAVQRLLAGWNYDDFTPSTMQTGEGLLSDAGFDSLEGWTERGLQDSMPHLVLSNMAMGEIIKHMTQNTPDNQALSVLDTGSGTGCTLAGVVLGVQDAQSSKISITGIEGTQSFFDTLGTFSDGALDRIPEAGLEKQMFDQGTDTHLVETGQMNMIYGDILDTVKNLEFSQEIQNGVLVITANYVWHRLPSSLKRDLVETITQKATNVVFLVADLVQNASAVNRGYFNFTPNGPLNCGNIGLEEIFKESGYTVTHLNEKTAPSTMNLTLAEKIGEGTTSDSIFYMAHRGEKAAALLA